MKTHSELGTCRGGRGFGHTPAALPGIPLLAAGVLWLLLSICSCGTQRKLSAIRGGVDSVSLQLPAKQESFVPDVKNITAPVGDTLKVTGLDGEEMLIMKAIRDDESGEMVATEQLEAAVVTARFRNIAERHGKIDLEFQIIVPASMQDSKWQLRFHPDMYVLEDSVRLDDILITGTSYRKAQLRGYQHYERFLRRIVSDTTRFVDARNLEIWLSRNIPSLYAFKNDTSFVSDEAFRSCFGVSERQAMDHYTNKAARRANERRKASREKMFRRYVKSPIATEHIRLDTVMVDGSGDFVYNYVQTISTRARLRSVDIVLGGEIYEEDRQIYTMPRSAPLTFYVSFVSAFVDDTPRYLTRIISRDAVSSAECIIDFGVGRSDIDETLGENARVVAEVKRHLRALLLNDSFEMDSVTITASASPEGSEKANNQLSFQRARSASAYFESFVRQVTDSLEREEGLYISVGEDLQESGMKVSDKTRRAVNFISHSGGENWPLLDDLVREDSLISDADIRIYDSKRGLGADERERALSSMSCYRHLREDLYPRLRTVRFRFALHRRGMVKDTVHTTVLDSAYMAGVQMIRDHDYEGAAGALMPYNDYNAAVAYVALDRNISAMNILRDLERTAQVNYMLALLYSREGDERNAVECYVRSCQQNSGYVFRGNLDPEISVLIKKYNLNAEPDDF